MSILKSLHSLPALVLAAAAALLLAAAPSASAAAPVSNAELVRLLEAGIGESVIHAVVAERGYTGTLEVDDLVALRLAGASDSLLRYLLAVRPGGSGVDGVGVHEEDGVIVVSGSGIPEDEPQALPELAQDEAPLPPEPQPPSYADEWPAEAGVVTSNAYPSGAVVGATGSVVFLPARFGDAPSAFGRTIVTSMPAVAGCGGCFTDCGADFYPAPYVAEPRTITIRSSHGLIRVPN